MKKEKKIKKQKNSNEDESANQEDSLVMNKEDKVIEK